MICSTKIIAALSALGCNFVVAMQEEEWKLDPARSRMTLTLTKLDTDRVYALNKTFGDDYIYTDKAYTSDRQAARPIIRRPIQDIITEPLTEAVFSTECGNMKESDHSSDIPIEKGIEFAGQTEPLDRENVLQLEPLDRDSVVQTEPLVKNDVVKESDTVVNKAAVKKPEDGVEQQELNSGKSWKVFAYACDSIVLAGCVTTIVGAATGNLDLAGIGAVSTLGLLVLYIFINVLLNNSVGKKGNTFWVHATVATTMTLGTILGYGIWSIGSSPIGGILITVLASISLVVGLAILIAPVVQKCLDRPVKV